MDKTVALYMRLSDEDDNLAAHEESNSISHQRKLMLDHIQKLPELKDCNIIEFADDGYSGADFNRPDFVKMMGLVKAGKIQVIVTKDYSRLGRDYLEVGNYMECIFPVLQVRYILPEELEKYIPYSYRLPDNLVRVCCSPSLQSPESYLPLQDPSFSQNQVC